MVTSLLHSRTFYFCSTLLLIAAVLVSPWQTNAQEEKHGYHLSWNDAPLVPRHRSQADWLVDVGWKTYDEVFGPFPTHEYQLEEEEQFVPLGYFEENAKSFYLRYRSEHAYFWFERGTPVDPVALEETARFFEDHIWPLNSAIYGEVWDPGIDGDTRLHVINQESIEPGVMGAFNPEDQCPRLVCPASNQRDIIYISLDFAPLNSQEYLTTLAHEHQHLIQFHVDGNEMRWFNEGLSQLAEHLNGFDPRYIGSDTVVEFLNTPDHPLNGWAENEFEIARYYGAGYLFLVYLYERFGLEFIRQLASTDYDGLAAVQNTLAVTGQTASVDDVFADWIVANYLDDPYASGGAYYYQTLDLPSHIRPTRLEINGQPYTNEVNPYGAHYLSLDEPGTYDLSFDGSDDTSLIGTEPRSKDWMWWSYNSENGAARLTGAFDLTGLTTATLKFSLWWDTEEESDWFQVLASGNGGQEWAIVAGNSAKPNKGPDAPGAHYTGASANWIDERIDLSDYVGGPVLIRFEYLTDFAITTAGVALDDIGIEELGGVDDTETAGASVWNPEGFLRVPGTVPQSWTVALIQDNRDKTAVVEHLALDGMNTGRATITVPQGGRVVLAIGTMVPFSSTKAFYKLTIQPHQE
jgi:hypothetical protein